MDYVYCTTTRIKGSHLTYENRQTLERLVVENHKRAKKDRLSQSQMAEKLGVHRSTISRELKRGRITQRDSEWREYISYSADVAQDHVDENALAKGPELKLGKDKAFHDFVEYWIVEKKYSPDAVIMKIQHEGLPFETSICTKTLYNYIDKGYFLHLTNKDLPRQGRGSKRKSRRVRRSHRGGGKSIVERPEFVNNRKEFGHWEMDCIESNKGARSCLLTLVERQSNYSITMRLKAQTKQQVIEELDLLERKLGRPKFAQVFKTITVDNGSEFLDSERMESSLFAKMKKRTQVYYCHPYSAYERGSNEQMNGQIRRFIPKGTDMSTVSKARLNEITEHLNNYPKRRLQGKTSKQLFTEALRGFGIVA